jgi:hypothetical protein
VVIYFPRLRLAALRSPLLNFHRWFWDKMAWQNVPEMVSVWDMQDISHAGSPGWRKRCASLRQS